MSLNPFQADALVVARLAAIPVKKAIDIRQQAAAASRDGVISAASVNRLVASYDLSGVRELMLLLLDLAKDYARPPISNFFVGAVGLESPSGDLILGGNIEFPGAQLAMTLHGEGFVATRAFNRGADLAVIAIGEAHPCAHCRQYLSEFAAIRSLELIDPLGHTLTLAQLYPWPFDPDYLGEPGAVPALSPRPDLELEPAELSHGVAKALLAAGRHAHAPYSKCPGAVVLELNNGRLLSGASIESVAFNPTIGPLQASLIELLAAGHSYEDIASVTLGTMREGAVDYSGSVKELLATIAPQARLTVVGWSQ